MYCSKEKTYARTSLMAFSISGIVCPDTLGLGSSGWTSTSAGGSQGQVEACISPSLYQCALENPFPMTPVARSTLKSTEEWSVIAPALPSRSTAERALITPLSFSSPPWIDLQMVEQKIYNDWGGNRLQIYHEEVVITRMVERGALGGNKAVSQAALLSFCWIIQSPPAVAFL